MASDFNINSIYVPETAQNYTYNSAWRVALWRLNVTISFTAAVYNNRFQLHLFVLVYSVHK